MIRTITENGALFRAQHPSSNQFNIAIRFCDVRLKQLRRLERREKRALIWLKIRILTGGFFGASLLPRRTFFGPTLPPPPPN
jgi:hypothetical protein